MAIAPWLPGFTFVDLDLTGVQAPEVGRPYDETSRPKVCLHTTEGSTLAGAERAFAAYPPHVGVDPRTGQRHQYLPLDRCSFSLKGSESDDEFVVQVEIVGFAGRGFTADQSEWLGRAVLAPISKAIGCPLTAAPQGFHGEGEGIVLASANSPIRFPSEAALRSFSGVFGHQHAPAPDTHWDPGAIDIDRILTAARGDAMTPEQQERLDRQLLTIRQKVESTFNQVNLRTGLVLNALAQLDVDVDEAAIAAAVVSGMPVETLAAAIAEHMSADDRQALLDELAARLAG